MKQKEILIIFGICILSFLWMMSGGVSYLMNPDIELKSIIPQPSNLFFRIILGLLIAVIWIFLNFISVGFSLFWLYGGFLLIRALIENNKPSSNQNYSSKYSSSYGSNSYSNSYSNHNIKNYTQEELKEIETKAISKGILAPGKRGQYIDKQTGKFKEEYFFNLLSRNTDDSIDLASGKYQTKNIFGFKTDTGKKIDIESGRIYKKKDFGYEKTETRINQTTGRIEKKDGLGIFWNKTDERINPRTGKKEKKDDLGLFWNEVDE